MVRTVTFLRFGQNVERRAEIVATTAPVQNTIAETDASGNNSNEYVFFGGNRIARVNSGGDVIYYMKDHRGTSRVISDASGTILDDSDFYPFGGERSVTSSSGNTHKFTGKDRDSESGNDYFGARYYSSTTGRFISADPGWFLVADPSNPQTWNQYSYALNNPLRFIDPTGMDACYWDDGTYDDDPSDGGATEDECYDQGGTWIPTVQQSVTVTPDFPAPCSQTLNVGQRVSTGIQGALNLGVGGTKMVGSGAVTALALDVAPETLGATLPIAAISLYGVTSSAGQFTTGVGQLLGAVTGNLQGAASIQQLGDILGGPVSGSMVLASGGSPAAAQQAANQESLYIAGASFFSAVTSKEAIQAAFDVGLSTLGLSDSSGGCQ